VSLYDYILAPLNRKLNDKIYIHFVFLQIYVNAMSRSLFMNSSLNSDNASESERETTATMLVLMNAIAECRNKNTKKAVVEFNESYSATHDNDDLFTSKLLELSYGDLELLYQTLCYGDGKHRRSSKQYEKKSGSFKKKTSVGDISFANAGFEAEMRPSSSSSSSLGSKRSQVSLTEDSLQGKTCLRKAYLLLRDIQRTDEPNTQNEAFLNIGNIHLKVENFYTCAVLCVEYKEKFTVEHFLCTLDDVQRKRIADICLLIASKKPPSIDIEPRIEYSKMAVKLQPNIVQPVACLCNLYRVNNETEKAFATAKIFLDEINSEDEDILTLQIICLTDTSKLPLAIEHLQDFLQRNPNYEQLTIMLSVLYILSSECEKGIDIMNNLEIYDDNEKKKIYASILELLKVYILHSFVFELYAYFMQNTVQSRKETASRKSLLLLAARILAYRSTDNLEMSKLYVDCLYFCDELDAAQDFLIKLVKEYPKETLPMVYLANIRLKVGAYVASTEDFRALLEVYGEDNLTKNLSILSIDERKEIARVHRLHGVRFLSNELAFREAAECFTVVLCAIGPAAGGLSLSRGYCYMHLNDFKAAERDFKECLIRNEFITAALCARAVLFAVTTHVKEALCDFKEAFSIDPLACQKCLPKLPFEHVTVFTQLIDQHVKQGIEEPTKSKKKLYDIKEIDTFDSTTVSNSLDPDILQYSEFLCKVFPSNVNYVLLYIECLHLTNDKAKMQLAIERALSAFPGEKTFEVWRGLCLAEQKKFDEAINEIKDICSVNKDTLRVLNYISSKTRKQVFDRSMKKGRKTLEKENFSVAISYFTLASCLFTKDIAPLRERLECYSRTGEQKKWLTDLGRILVLNPSSADFCIRASYYRQHGEDLRACEDYISAIDINEAETIRLVTMNANTEDITRLFHVTALSLTQVNKTRNVARICEVGLKFDPNHKGLKQLIEKASVNRCSIQ